MRKMRFNQYFYWRYLDHESDICRIFSSLDSGVFVFNPSQTYKKLSAWNALFKIIRSNFKMKSHNQKKDNQ